MPMSVHVVDATILMDSQRFDRLGTVNRSDVVIEIGAACNGNQQIISQITNRVGLAQIDKLIFYGHAGPGIMNTAAGKEGGSVAENAGFGVDCRPGAPCDENQWRTLAPYFAPKGCVILKGCNVAQGSTGQDLLRRLSRVFGVNVYGSDWYQATGMSYLVGNVYRASPDGSVVEDTGYKNGGLWRLLQEDAMAALAVGFAELFYDPN